VAAAVVVVAHVPVLALVVHVPAPVADGNR